MIQYGTGTQQGTVLLQKLCYLGTDMVLKTGKIKKETNKQT